MSITEILVCTIFHCQDRGFLSCWL